MINLSRPVKKLQFQHLYPRPHVRQARLQVTRPQPQVTSAFTWQLTLVDPWHNVAILVHPIYECVVFGLEGGWTPSCRMVERHLGLKSVVISRVLRVHMRLSNYRGVVFVPRFNLDTLCMRFVVCVSLPLECGCYCALLWVGRWG